MSERRLIHSAPCALVCDNAWCAGRAKRRRVQVEESGRGGRYWGDIGRSKPRPSRERRTLRRPRPHPRPPTAPRAGPSARAYEHSLIIHYRARPLAAPLAQHPARARPCRRRPPFHRRRACRCVLPCRPPRRKRPPPSSPPQTRCPPRLPADLAPPPPPPPPQPRRRQSLAPLPPRCRRRGRRGRARRPPCPAAREANRVSRLAKIIN